MSIKKAPSGTPLAVTTANHTSHYDGTGIAGDTITLTAVGHNGVVHLVAVQGDGTWGCNATTPNEATPSARFKRAQARRRYRAPRPRPSP